MWHKFVNSHVHNMNYAFMVPKLDKYSLKIQ